MISLSRMIEEATTRTQEILEDLGLEIVPGGIVSVSDIRKADCAYVHHTRMPVAVTGYALVSKNLAAGRFPKLGLLDVVAKRMIMDAGETIALARLCGFDMRPISAGNAEQFADHLFDVIKGYQMEPFFCWLDTPLRSSHRHYCCRPTGWDWDGDRELQGGVAAWRKAYRALSPERQMMVATIMTLYRGRKDDTWMVRVPCRWAAADAIVALNAAGYLKDWGGLLALYPGW